MCVESQVRPLAELLAESRRRFFTMAMFQVYANSLAALMSELEKFEREISKWGFAGPAMQQQRIDRLVGMIVQCRSYTDTLSLKSSTRQIQRIGAVLDERPVTPAEMRTMFQELKTRIEEDIQDCVFYCINDPIRMTRFFTKSSEQPNAGFLVPKRSDEIYDRIILDCFPESEDDLVETCECFVFHRYTACVFHLMRVVEFGLLRIARLAGISDPKPSWGTVLNQLDRLAFRTKYGDLPDSVRPHVATIKNVLPTLNAIQHAWRNKVSHADLAPKNGISEEICLEIMNAVQAFMRILATSLPRPVAAP